MGRRKTSAADLLIAIMGSPVVRRVGSIGSNGTAKQMPNGTCIQCGKPKSHNNAFCSATCCREHRKGKDS